MMGSWYHGGHSSGGDCYRWLFEFGGDLPFVWISDTICAYVMNLSFFNLMVLVPWVIHLGNPSCANLPILVPIEPNQMSHTGLSAGWIRCLYSRIRPLVGINDGFEHWAGSFLLE